MKKLLFFAALLIGVSFSNEAAAQPQLLRMANDTVSNAVTTYAYFGTVASKGAINGAVEDLGYTYTHTEVSGTTAAVVTLEASNDGVLWQTHPRATLDTLTDVASQSKIKEIGAVTFKYLRLKIVPSGTQKGVFAGEFVLRAKK